MAIIPIYLERYAYQKPQIAILPSKDLGIIIVIPCLNEPDLFEALISIRNCHQPVCSCEVILVINHGENADLSIKKENSSTFKAFQHFAIQNNSNWLKFHAIYAADLPTKDAGVGLARKIGMDEAVWRFQHAGNPKGIIANFDADCTCDSNYLTELYQIFHQKNNITGCTIYFEHPLKSPDGTLNNAIINYELHIRYYIDALRYAGYPYAFHTVGSCMAVRSDIYQKQGGMNKKKAAEDFYFLHKIFPLGGFCRLNSTAIRPSSRMSSRVPFGTGVTMIKFAKSAQQLQTYHWQTFENLRLFILKVPDLASSNKFDLNLLEDSIPENIAEFLVKINFKQHANRIRKHANNVEGFLKSFWHWFGGFILLKYVHFSRDHYFPDQPVEDSVRLLLQNGYKIDDIPDQNLNLLITLRHLDRQSD